MRKLNFLIAEDVPLVRKGIILTLENNNLVANVLEASTGEEAVAFALSNPVDFIVLDYSLSKLNGFEVSKQIMLRKKPVKILIITEFCELPVILNFLKIGVRGLISKYEDDKELIDAIRTVMNGDYYYPSQFDDLVDDWLKGNLPTSIPAIHFSKREIQMVTLISRGFTATEIAKEMSVSVRTIETYRYDLIRKTHVSNTSELIGYSYRNGLI